MTNSHGPAVCACGEPATERSRKRGTPRCVACSEAVMRAAVLEMTAKSGPAWEKWQTAGGADGFARARSSPRTHAARLANIAKAQAANAARRSAEATADSGVSVVEPAPVPPPRGLPVVPAVVFRAPW